MSVYRPGNRPTDSSTRDIKSILSAPPGEYVAPSGVSKAAPVAQPTTPGEQLAARWRQTRARLARYGTLFTRALLFAAGVAVAFVAILLYNVLVPAPRPLTTKDVNATVAQALASATPLPAFSEQVYQVIQPSLVLVQAQTSNASGGVEHGLGSGVVVNDQGDVLTALHVVTQATDIELTFADGTKATAVISSTQDDHDIAVLHASNVPTQVIPATLGNPNSAKIGDEAYVVGNPFGLYASMSAGVISGFGRSIQPVNTNQTLKDLIQIDAAVNPGNSGGPLLNRYGEVIGIVTGLVNPTEQNFFVGVGFAVPITTATQGVGVPPW